MQETNLHTNKLIHESSPYLLQHAHNPVDWYAWGEEAWQKAKEENKLVLVSIGYSSCHWCHVMEGESFEDDSVAELMNRHFICIKVDREERPDVDHVYMSAVQLMTGSGGWPLNCFTLPDGRPIYGGTYFPKQAWKSVLNQLHEFYSGSPEQANKYADELTQGLARIEQIYADAPQRRYDRTLLLDMVARWKNSWDREKGGPNRAPKFPLPNNYEFLLDYGILENDQDCIDYVELSLDKMAAGGLYDQIGGGFARYSTDMEWKVPHFEKMLYDNGQLLSLYSKAWRYFKKDRYRDIVFQSIEWLNREMRSDDGVFYSALDADSEGEEGKYYVWKKEELEKLSKDKLNGKGFDVLKDLYSINNEGLWEHGNYILLLNESFESIALRHELSETQIMEFKQAMDKVLLKEREARVRPGLDDKILCSWNALTISGLCEAYKSFNRTEDLESAVRAGNFIFTKMYAGNGKLYHNYKAGKTGANGFLDDYAFMIHACLDLYSVSFDESWLIRSRELAEYSLQHFYDEAGEFFWYNSDEDPPLITRKKEIQDNVTPASNSSMARALFLLASYWEKESFRVIANNMCGKIAGEMPSYGSAYSNWALAMMQEIYPFREIVICGKNAQGLRIQLQQSYQPNTLFAGSERPGSKSGLLLDRWQEGKTLIYVCQNRTCKLPVETAEEAIKQLDSR